jgi:hypothetical protein
MNVVIRIDQMWLGSSGDCEKSPLEGAVMGKMEDGSCLSVGNWSPYAPSLAP